jgi:hypothetical protein
MPIMRDLVNQEKIFNIQGPASNQKGFSQSRKIIKYTRTCQQSKGI